MESRNLPVPAPTEPTNAQIVEGTWQQPARSVEVVVPEGVYAQLQQARVLYEELTPEAYRAYCGVASFYMKGESFASEGDMSPEAAEALAVAQASGVFSRIYAYVPPAKLSPLMEAAIIGEIDTAGESVKYFRINPAAPGMGETAQVIGQWKAHWWADVSHRYAVIMTLAVLVGLGGPITLAILFGGGFLLLLLLCLPLVALAGDTIPSGIREK